jgi:hypothetical protein
MQSFQWRILMKNQIPFQKGSSLSSVIPRENHWQLWCERWESVWQLSQTFIRNGEGKDKKRRYFCPKGIKGGSMISLRTAINNVIHENEIISIPSSKWKARETFHVLSGEIIGKCSLLKWLSKSWYR